MVKYWLHAYAICVHILSLNAILHEKTVLMRVHTKFDNFLDFEF